MICIYINFLEQTFFPCVPASRGSGNPHPPRKCRRNIATPLAAVDGFAAPKVRARLVKRGGEKKKGKLLYKKKFFYDKIILC